MTEYKDWRSNKRRTDEMVALSRWLRLHYKVMQGCRFDAGKVSKATGVSKATVLRHLDKLVVAGYLVKTEVPYRPGRTKFEFAFVFREQAGTANQWHAVEHIIFHVR